MKTHSHRLLTAMAAVLATGMLLSVSACGTASNTQSQNTAKPEATGPIEVVASVNQWGSLAKQIGGDDVSVTSILSSTAVDAHDFEPKTSDIAKLQKAQIVVTNGAGYDAWATKSLGRNAVSVSAAQTVGAMEGDNPHLWFSKDARNGVAEELTEAFSKVLPSKKKAFATRLAAWKKQEKTIEQAMDDFSAKHKDAKYGATEAVAYYLMSDMGFEDATPKGYAQSSASEGEPAPADLQEFQALIESRDIDVLINNTQEASDATNMLTGTAGRSDVPVFDISEQLPDDQSSLTDWIADLVSKLTDVIDEASAAEDDTDADTQNDTTSETQSDGSDGTAGDSSDTQTQDDSAATTQDSSPDGEQPDPGK
ncbi:ABC transporter, substrate-binding protein [Bifidobacterium goeldii]|uniref:ABC transporter, substrate-binding protein n=1 Tax=Bifidobacterium goeldii TaxID=2306975 RepID=A0A430FM59_9BIFI|nr:zinc ABC transporter substrate-binding protein [Bifidobacterium goeldii]RSX53989.1 ABC transporter, substrate-binding protein [Bifidobacterium goeldii]